MSGGDDDRDPVEILADEFLERYRRGEQVSVTDYEKRFPEQAVEIREVLTAMLAMETARPTPVIAPAMDTFRAVASGEVRKLGDFRIIRKVAHGGMGVVYEAEEISLRRRVAIKVLASNLLADEAALERFQREARTIARLHHTNIVSVFGAGAEKDLHFFVMGFIDGKSLDRWIESGQFSESRRNDWRWIVEVARRIALALRHAHQQDVLHRDVKPGNILIDENGKPWITDFGLAKFGENDDLTRPGDAVGTLRYMAPEQLEGNPDPRSDIYGLGLVLYEMLTVEKIYGDCEPAKLLERISSCDLPSPCRSNPDIPKDLEMITLKAIARDPADRYQTAEELADDLERWQNDQPIRARPLTAAESLNRWSRRHPLIASLLSLVICLFLVLCVAVGVISFAWLGEHSAKLDARLAEQKANESRREAEDRVSDAMHVLDELSSDLAMFNPIGTDPEHQGFLFSPMGGIPVSKKTERQLDLIHDFYQGAGQATNQRTEIQFRIFLAKIRSAEIALQLGKYQQGKEELLLVVENLRKQADARLSSLRLYAGDLIGYANLQAGYFEDAEREFKKQLELIDSVDISQSRKRLEKGKALLGLGLVARNQGKTRQWHDYLLAAKAELESELDWRRPEDSPATAVFLARTCLNLPRRYAEENYEALQHGCVTRAVSILSRLHLLQKQRAGENGEETSLLFFYDYCDAVASIPGELSEIELLNEPPRSVSRLLETTIRECQAVVEGNPDMAQFRFVLSRCQLNLALRSSEEFVAWSQKALEHLDILKGDFKNNPRFLTEHGRTQYRIGLYRLSSKDHAGAKEAFQHAVHSLENSLQLSPGFPETRVLLPEVHGKLALVYELLNVPTAARHHRSQESAIRAAYPHEYQ